jgi:hypothetical protein
MINFRPPKLYWADIRELTQKIRTDFLARPDEIPIPIEEIIEFRLRIYIDPQPFLKEEFGVDGQLLSDLSTIIVDSRLCNNEKYLPRLRFTLAHELGHFYLHKDQIIKAHFSSIDEWIEFRQSIPEEDISWFEKQADEFAGSLLVPSNMLRGFLEDKRSKITKYINETNSDEAHERAIDAISMTLCAEFGVSHNVIETRIRKEKLWDELGFYNI